jgi:large subunit ribosomal protein L34
MSITYQPKNKKRFTTHGFLVRMATKAGAKIVNLRRSLGRTKLAVVKGGKNFTR